MKIAVQNNKINFRNQTPEYNEVCPLKNVCAINKNLMF